MSTYVRLALANARRKCAAVEATEHGETAQGNRSREFYFPSGDAVLQAASTALRAEKLMLVLKSVGAVTVGVEGHELPITFELFHEETGDSLEFTWVWPLFDQRGLVGRHAARAATLTSAEKHFQLHLLALNVTGRDAASVAAKAAGPMPGWMTDRPRLPGPPAHASEYFLRWSQGEFRRMRAGGNLQAEPPEWPDLVAMLYGGDPREVASAAEEEHVCRYLASCFEVAP